MEITVTFNWTYQPRLGHYQGKVIGIDPHRIKSYSKRQMVRRKKDQHSPPSKQLQTFFAIDVDSQQPICLTLGSSSRTVAQETPLLLQMAADILRPKDLRPLVLCDAEHYVHDLLTNVPRSLPFDLLVPMLKGTVADLYAIPEDAFTRHWIGYATHHRPYRPKTLSEGEECYWQTVQRKGEKEGDYEMNAFICTAENTSIGEPVQHYPKRWHCEEQKLDFRFK